LSHSTASGFGEFLDGGAAELLDRSCSKKRGYDDISAIIISAERYEIIPRWHAAFKASK